MNCVMPNQVASRAIRAELARRGLHQQDLAAALGMNPSQLSLRMTGQIAWRVHEMQAIARHLQVPITALIDDDAELVDDAAGSAVSA
jgi:transcriptional regulator with XRE-family HTH domain